MENQKVNYSYIFIKRHWNSISTKYKAVLLGALLGGLLAHIYQFTNKLFNYDELHATPLAIGEGFGYGRWMQEFIYRIIRYFWGNYSLPVINGVISLLFFSLGACIIVYVLDINNEAYACVVGGLCTTFPVVTCSFFYMYMSYYFALAMFLSVVSVAIITKYRNIIGFISGALCLACSIGIYQSYFSVAVSLTTSYLVIYCIKISCESDCDIVTGLRRYVKKAFTCLVFLISGLILYLVINKLIIWVTKENMVEYQGINQMGLVDLSYIFKSIASSYVYYLKLFTSDVFQTNPTNLVKVSFFVLNVFALLLFLVFTSKIKKRCVSCLTIVSSIFVPASIFIIFAIANKNTYYYSLMMYSVIFALLLPIAVIDNCSSIVAESCTIFNVQLVKVIDCLSYIICSFIIMSYIWFANGNYQALQYTNYHDIFYYSTMVTQIKSLDGYRDDIPIVMLGDEIVDLSNNAGSLMINDFNIKGKAESNINAWSFFEIIRGYIGFTQDFLWDDYTQNMLKENKQVVEMPSYPQSGSIKMINDIIVVKLSD